MQQYISIVHDMRVRPPDERRIRRNGQHIDARLAQLLGVAALLEVGAAHAHALVERDASDAGAPDRIIRSVQLTGFDARTEQGSIEV